MFFYICIMKKLIGKLKKYFKRVDKRLKHIYTDKNGVNYYILNDDDYISKDRIIKLLEVNRHVELCLTYERLKYICDKIKNALNTQKYSDISLYVNDLLISEQMFCEEETLKKMASIFIYLDNEPIDRYEEFYQNKKMEYWSKDKDAKFFFVNLAWKTTKRHSQYSSLDVRKYLEALKKVEM